MVTRATGATQLHKERDWSMIFQHGGVGVNICFRMYEMAQDRFLTTEGNHLGVFRNCSLPDAVDLNLSLEDIQDYHLMMAFSDMIRRPHIIWDNYLVMGRHETTYIYHVDTDMWSSFASPVMNPWGRLSYFINRDGELCMEKAPAPRQVWICRHQFGSSKWTWASHEAESSEFDEKINGVNIGTLPANTLHKCFS